MPGRVILHVDMDAFFVAVEQLFQPALQGKPVIVGGDPGGRSVVSSASYEARACGVHSAMPMAWAKKLCPQGIFLPCNFERYTEVSRMIFRLLQQFTPDVEEASVDEAYLDISGCERLFGPPLAMAHRIREAIRQRLGLSASVGVAGNRTVAKIASELAKPAGLLQILPGQEAAFLAPLPAGRMPGIGEATQRRLQMLGIRTLGDLAALDDRLLERAFGVYGPQLRRRALGLDNEGVRDAGPCKSIGKETTFGRDAEEREEVETVLATLVEKVCRKLRQGKLGARTITVKLRYSDFQTSSRSRTLATPVQYDPAVIHAARELFRQLDIRRLGIRLVGISVSRLQPEVRQRSLFDAPREIRQEKLYGSLDTIRDRYGSGSLRPASRLGGRYS